MNARLSTGAGEHSRALSALCAISPDCSGEVWLKAGMAAKAAGIGFDEFNSWSSRGGDSYKGERDTRARWDSWRADGGIKPATLFHLAQERGWDERSASIAPISPPPRQAPAAKPPRRPAPDPSRLWDDAEPASAEHAYIVRKDGSADGLRVYHGPLRIAGESVDGWLMIPARTPDGQMQSLQFIPPTPGKKLNLPGATMAGAFHVVGDLCIDAPAFIVEGIGAAWTVHEATGAAAVVTFGSGNTARVADAVRGRAARLVLVADRGKERTREAEASRLGCAWVELPRDLPDGADVNDLHIRDGIEAVKALVRNERRAPATDSAPAARHFAFTRVGDMIGDIKPVAWLVRKYFEADSLALMFGDPGCGKSFAAIDLAGCVATGKSWHGHKTTPGAVFYIAGEGLNGLSRRFRAWELCNDTRLRDAPLFVSTRPAQLYDAAAALVVSDTVEELAESSGQKPALIVIDTLARNLGGADENSAQEMGAFIANLDEFLRARFRACVLIVHHSGHADKSRARGSTALKGALDAEYSVTKDETGMVRLEATKMKDAEQPEPVAFRMDRIELPIEDEDGEPVHSVALSSVPYVPPAKAGKSGRGRNQTVALQALVDLTEEHRARVERSGRDPAHANVSSDAWRDRLAEIGFDRFQFRDVRKSLLAAGKIAIDPGGYVRLL